MFDRESKLASGVGVGWVMVRPGRSLQAALDEIGPDHPGMFTWVLQEKPFPIVEVVSSSVPGTIVAGSSGMGPTAFSVGPLSYVFPLWRERAKMYAALNPSEVDRSTSAFTLSKSVR